MPAKRQAAKSSSGSKPNFKSRSAISRHASAQSFSTVSKSQLSQYRGLPSILISCERGKESKAKSEARQIISHHLEQVAGEEKSEAGAQSPVVALSLDDEINQLREERNKPKKGVNGGVQFVDTGISGLILAVFSKGERLRFLKDEDGKTGGKVSKVDGGESEEGSGGESEDEDATAGNTKSLQPRSIVTTIVLSTMNALRLGISDGPRSRFVLRLVPLIATCYPNLQEMSEAGRIVVEEMGRLREQLNLTSKSTETTKSTFGITYKKRMCSKAPTQAEIIEKIGSFVDDDQFKVDLTKPDFTIVVEVFKNLAGVSVVPRFWEVRKCNLLECATSFLSEKEEKDDDDDDDDN